MLSRYRWMCHLPKIFFLLFFLVSLGSCGSVRTLKPIPQGESQLHFSIGGPLIEMGAPIPAPYTILGFGYGLSPSSSLQVAWHPSALLFKIFALDAGLQFQIRRESEHAPQMNVLAAVILASNFKSTAAYPWISPTIAKTWGSWTPYLGMDFLFQIHDNDRLYLPQTMAPYLGTTWRVSNTCEMGFEIKWAAMNHDLKYSQINHPKFLGDNGVLAPYFYFNYHFGKDEVAP